MGTEDKGLFLTRDRGCVENAIRRIAPIQGPPTFHDVYAPLPIYDWPEIVAWKPYWVSKVDPLFYKVKVDFFYCFNIKIGSFDYDPALFRNGKMIYNSKTRSPVGGGVVK